MIAPASHATAPTHVAHVVLSLDVGGLERLVVDLARAGRAAGQPVTVVCLERPGLLSAQAAAANARVISMGKRPGVRPLLFGRLARLFASLKPDVVHTHQVGALFYAGPAARLAGIKAVVHTEHGKHYATRARTRLLGRLAGRSAARFLCVSTDIADEVLRQRIVPPSKIHFAPNGIDVARYTPSPNLAARTSCGIDDTAFVIGTVGRLTEIKRQDLLIRAFARYKALRPQAHLLIVGDGPQRPRLAALAEQFDLRHSVQFAGYQKRPEDWLRLMDVFTLTSRSEGMPLGVLEAWAAGVPVITTAVGGLPELLQQGRAGLLVPFDDPSALIAAWDELFESPRLRAQLAHAGKVQVESTFALDRMVERYQAHYRDVLAARGAPV